jgi:hypothetical protein
LFLTGVIAVFLLVKRRKSSKERASSGDSLSVEEQQVLDSLLDKKP